MNLRCLLLPLAITFVFGCSSTSEGSGASTSSGGSSSGDPTWPVGDDAATPSDGGSASRDAGSAPARDAGSTSSSSGGSTSSAGGPPSGDAGDAGTSSHDSAPAAALGGSFTVDGQTITCAAAQTASPDAEVIFSAVQCDAPLADVDVAILRSANQPIPPGTYACAPLVAFVDVLDVHNDVLQPSSCSIDYANPGNGEPVTVTVSQGVFSNGAYKTFTGTFKAPPP